MPHQTDLFADQPAIPGLQLAADAIDPAWEDALADRIDAAPLDPFRFGQWTGKRLTANYGSAYDYSRGKTTTAPPLPDWLVSLRDSLAPAFGLTPTALQQALLIRYDPGAGIGWHRDRPQYGQVIGLSLNAPAVLRLRQRQAEGGFHRHAVPLAPRSAYMLSGPVREAWEHSIAPIEETRRSITFRTLREALE